MKNLSTALLSFAQLAGTAGDRHRNKKERECVGRPLASLSVCRIAGKFGEWAFAALALLLVSIAPLVAQDAKPAAPPSGTEWTRTISQRTERGTLGDQQQMVRGDSGKWNDSPRLQHLPAPRQKTPRQSLDDWADQAASEKFQPTPADENWLVFRTKQLDDNDRVWVERIERKGNEFVITLNQAIWQGKYFKTFTYYQVVAVNLGRLAPGSYKAKWIIKPLEFKSFEDPGKPQDSQQKLIWPKDENPSAGRKEVELTVAFTVAKSQ